MPGRFVPGRSVPGQLWALTAAATRELLWGLRAVEGEVGRWQVRAGAIPDASLREDALHGLTRKRDNIEGAAMFWTLPRRRDSRLLALLVGYETMADFLDGADERAASAGAESGRLLQRALTEALDPENLDAGALGREALGREGVGREGVGREGFGCGAFGPVGFGRKGTDSNAFGRVDMDAGVLGREGFGSGGGGCGAFGPTGFGRKATDSNAFGGDHEAFDRGGDHRTPDAGSYGHNTWHDDGGYLRTLVGACRAGCAALPAYARVRLPAVRAAALAGVQALNHEPDPDRRAALLQRWAARELPTGVESSWFERTAADSAWLTVLVLLALATEPALEQHEYEMTCAAYLWITMAATMLDSYTDMEEDAASGAHSYIEYYPNREIAVRRACELVRRASHEARALRDGRRHAVVVAGMVALYLSKDSALSPRLRPHSRAIVRAGGPLPMLLLPVLRIWRVAYTLRSAY